MADAISIPSPSVFLRSSPPPPRKESRERHDVVKRARGQSVVTKKAPGRRLSANAASASDRAQKLKQSKSRNGMSPLSYRHAGILLMWEIFKGNVC